MNEAAVLNKLSMADPVAAYREAVGERSAAALERFIPDYMHEGLVRFIVLGVRPGDFLSAYLCGDLFGALRRADDTNRKLFESYALFLFNYAPANCYGSPVLVADWCKGGGLAGRANAKTGGR